ncbi:hypothetical protein DPEC_G00285570 [Dallia pectoralis]|uniref:Uncharacterized protein n=1 Tax=Dallia pectoralis TaxID=75939 RepID=A0ACC2FJP9_DALPE|nr:hypothetical protein DPEC_G00285570 [Dallia pectoralis]
MAEAYQGAARADSVPEVGEDALKSDSPSVPNMTEEEQEELREQLLRVEEEIGTLSQVLASKEQEMADIKRKLGITPLNELKQNISKGWQEVTTSTAFRKTSESLSVAGQKASAAFTTMGSAITRKLEDVRNTPTFKSFEDKVETLKVKISPGASQGEEGMSSTATFDPAVPVEKQPEATPICILDEEPH